MPARIDRRWNIELPKGESFGLVLKNYGTQKPGADTVAKMAICDRSGTVVLLKQAEADEDGCFRFRLAPEDTMNMPEGAYMYDIAIEKYSTGADSASTYAAVVYPTERHTVFAPEMRRLIIGRVADDGV